MAGEKFEMAVADARNRGLFNLPGLVAHHFLKHIRGTRKAAYTAVWVYEDRKVWEKLWGTVDNPIKKENYPEKWKIWENQILAPLLAQDLDHIYYAAYEEY